MNPLAVVIVWGGFLAILMASSLATRDESRSTFDSTFASIRAAWESRYGAISLIHEETGRTERAVIYGNRYPSVFKIVVSPEGDALFAATDGGLFLSNDDGRAFRLVEKKGSLINDDSIVPALIFGKDSQGLLGAASFFGRGKGGVFLSRDNFKTFNEIFKSENIAAASLVFAEDEIYLGLTNGDLLAYSPKSGSLAKIIAFPSGVSYLAYGGSGRIYAALMSGGIFTSGDYGRSFTRQKFLDKYRGANNVRNLIAIPDSPVAYALTDYGIIRSENEGVSWEVFDSIPDKGKNITNIAVHDNGSISAASKDYVYQTSDGKRWEIFDPGEKREISTITPFRDMILVGMKN